jgi:hypothetical protein
MGDDPMVVPVDIDHQEHEKIIIEQAMVPLWDAGRKGKG